ncbi:signal transduction histidine kinase [Angulomicrobium tetraedrale]|uniref:histidine kinase n=1 Tax=Ancylobacter tetraedralis TaxID=217068 RepID=A0A839Z8P9_9HYPH|nr:signal transduction histidine kinase [Ancylobacter tetraedralis]
MADRDDHPASHSLSRPFMQPLLAANAAGLWGVVAILLSLVLVSGFVATMPFARAPLAHSELLLPAYASATGLLEGITAALLFSLYTVQRNRALLFLAAGYLFSALIVPSWLLSFPGLFPDFGFEFGLQTTAAIATVRRIGFTLFVLAYALAPARGIPRGTTRGSLMGAIAAVAGMVGLLTFAIFASRETLPAFMLDGRHVGRLWSYVPPIALALYGLDMAILLRRRRSQLDLWVVLVLFSLMVELLLISYLGGAIRLSVGWWAGRLYGLVAASIVLLALLAETTLVYARLARTVAAERRVRQNRLTAMEALSASIAHEINQPLASMVTNADAALRWLAKAEPRLDKAGDALRRIVEDGHRANAVVTGIRTMFTTGTQERAELDLNALVEGAVQSASTEAMHGFIEIRTDLAPSPLTVVGNTVQLHHVLRNLIENAIDSVRIGGEWPRRVIVRTRLEAAGEVHVSVADNGTGIASDIVERLFDPFVSTKPGGMGMGLMFCRAVVEAHGGRVWASPNQPRGAVFHFSLPAAMVPGGDAPDMAGADPRGGEQGGAR